MNAKLSKAVEAVERLPLEAQERLAETLLAAAAKEDSATASERVALHPADLPVELSDALDDALCEMADVEAADLPLHGPR